MQQLNEALQPGDLKMLVSNIFEIDSYASKMGNDEDIVVLSFTVESLEPAKDLENFIERGYDFVLDADATPGELENGKYKVFVEIERNRRIADQIMEILDGVSKLAEVDTFRFRYYKSFHSQIASDEALKSTIPNTKAEYDSKLKEGYISNFSNFFNRSYLESINIDENDLIFQKKYAEPLRLRIKGFGTKQDVYEHAPGKIMLESSAISEIMFLTKYIGNYNITKIGNGFVFENAGFALLVEKR